MSATIVYLVDVFRRDGDALVRAERRRASGVEDAARLAGEGGADVAGAVAFWGLLQGGVLETVCLIRVTGERPDGHPESEIGAAVPPAS